MAGLTKAGSQTRGDQNQLQTTSLQGAGPQEQRLRDQFAQLTTDQLGQLSNVYQQYGDTLNQARGSNTFALSPAEQEQLNQAYAGSEANLRRFGQIMGQDLAGTRGLNTSDTPVSEAVLRETMPAMASLQGQKMQYGLGLGMQARQNQFQNLYQGLSGLTGAATAAPQAGLGLAQSFQQDRLASMGRSGMSNSSMGMPWIERLGKAVDIVGKMSQMSGGFGMGMPTGGGK